MEQDYYMIGFYIFMSCGIVAMVWGIHCSNKDLKRMEEKRLRRRLRDKKRYPPEERYD